MTSRIHVSKKARRLVERACRLSAARAVVDTPETIQSKARREHTALHHRAWEAKQKLLRYVQTLETEAIPHDVRELVNFIDTVHVPDRDAQPLFFSVYCAAMKCLYPGWEPDEP